MKTVVTILCLGAVLISSPGTAVESVSRTHDGSVIAGERAMPFEPTLQAIQANVFTPSCALSFCHGDAMMAELDLREGASHAQLVNVPSVEDPSRLRVEQFNPDDSYLICKLEACATMIGQLMPIIGPPLDQPTIDVIRQWIADGAPEDPIAVEFGTWGAIKALYR